MKAIFETIQNYTKNEKVKCGNGVDTSVIKQAQDTMGILFPDDLKKYLAYYGWLTFGHFELFGLGDSIPKHLNIVQNYLDETTQGELPIDLIPFYNNGSGDLACVRSGSSNTPSSESKVLMYLHSDSSIEDQDDTFFSWIIKRIEQIL